MKLVCGQESVGLRDHMINYFAYRSSIQEIADVQYYESYAAFLIVLKYEN